MVSFNKFEAIKVATHYLQFVPMQVFPYKFYLPDQNRGLSEGIWALFAKKALLLGYELFQA